MFGLCVLCVVYIRLNCALKKPLKTKRYDTKQNQYIYKWSKVHRAPKTERYLHTGSITWLVYRQTLHSTIWPSRRTLEYKHGRNKQSKTKQNRRIIAKIHTKSIEKIPFIYLPFCCCAFLIFKFIFFNFWSVVFIFTFIFSKTLRARTLFLWIEDTESIVWKFKRFCHLRELYFDPEMFLTSFSFSYCTLNSIQFNSV